jgi:hypothetical protein
LNGRELEWGGKRGVRRQNEGYDMMLRGGIVWDEKGKRWDMI